MQVDRKTRRRVSLWMIGVLLFAQWLVAAYACPVLAKDLAQGAEFSASQPRVADCHGGDSSAMDTANPLLCKAHCDGDEQVSTQGITDELNAPAVVSFIVAACAPADALAQPADRPTAPGSGAPPGWPPLYLTHQVLRN